MTAASDKLDAELAVVRGLFGSAEHVIESGRTYVLVTGLRLPTGCAPESTDILLSPFPLGDGYESRLFLGARITGLRADSLNWQSVVRIADRCWHYFSWRTDSQERSLSEKIMLHLRAFIVGKA